MRTQLFKNYIGGQWVSAESVSTNRNPSNINDIVGEFSQADLGQTKAAIQAARDAFPAWAMFPMQERSNILARASAEILARKDELGQLLAREEGKTLPEAIGEVARAGQIFGFFAGEVLRMAGEKLPSVRAGVDVEITREPLGVIGIITPWNFPIAIPAWKIAPALAYGNTVVFKPAELVPASAWALVDILVRAGLPAGVLNLVMGRGSVVGEEIVTSREVDGVSFTGSVATGQSIAAKVVARMGKVQLEMGGKNPLVITDDADLDVAVECAIQGSYFSTGQRCTASSRLIVTPGIHDRFVQAMQARLSAVKVGDALATGTDIGPVVDQNQLETDLSYINIGVEEGARLLHGGERLQRQHDGFYLSPALFVDADNTMRIAREEIFGPVAAVIRANDYEHALELANDTQFGLCAGIVTTSLKLATHFKRHAQAGMVMVNLATAGVDYHVPFGGRKGSSYGPREQGRYAAEFYTTVKTAYVNA
ncbi:aldehyde dehydrogenase family protein [Advenella sp. WQ 585]|uniref:Aldehyde dehydrogenase n=2 Tax=Advenella TaxID=290425 RepID=A0A918JIM7_9BURK|nr:MULTISPECIES: aldehyde dehydrogenase family protein [Advenella]MBK1782208.1 aldehyde dehydrogenase family protein [Advenella mandrilli]GGW82752.1 aldehyde dehydrogenase [Advenella faeciporci]